MLKPRMRFYLLFIISLAAQSVSPGVCIEAMDFFAPPEKNGRIAVKVYPTENVAPGVPTLVTFGLPFTRGSIDEPGLATVRLFDGEGEELPAHVSQLTPWRHVNDTGIDGRSVRIAIVQFHYAPCKAYPEHETITVEWGGKTRTKDIPEQENAFEHWHLVDSGSFAAGDSVYKPDVYVVLPKEHLSNGSLKLTRMLPFSGNVPEHRESPQEIDEISEWTGYTKMDHAQHNFFFTLINEAGNNGSAGMLCPYKTEYEPWLYDRSTAMYILYIRSGNFRPLREAVRHAQYYRRQLWDERTNPERFRGLFRLKVPETRGYPTGNGAMYSYNQCLAYTFWLTGNRSLPDEIEMVAGAHELNDEQTRWDPSLGFWTERHIAFRLLANTIAYEVTGAEVHKRRLVSQYNDFIWHQNGAGGALPADRVDGGLYHRSGQHGDGDPSVFVASSWMTVLTVDAMLRVYALTGDKRVGEFIRRVGNFEHAAVKQDSDHIYGGGPLWYADYMMNHDGSSAARSGSMVEHSMEIAAAVAWAAYFSSLDGEPDTSLVNLAERLYHAYERGVNHWISPLGGKGGQSVFRVSPWRKYGWQYVPSGSFSWIMTNLKQSLKLNR